MTCAENKSNLGSFIAGKNVASIKGVMEIDLILFLT